MRTRKNRELNIFTVSFLDVFANAIGGLSFLLILAILMAGSVIFQAPKITTLKLPDGSHKQDYVAWLAAREGLGKFSWSFGAGEHPEGLQIDPETGMLHGLLELPASEGASKAYEFSIQCKARAADGRGEEKVDSKRYALTVYREVPIRSVPLRIVSEATLPPAQRSEPYSLTLAAEGGQPPYSWSGAAPSGLALSTEGRLSGSPSATGSHRFLVRVSTRRGEHEERTFVLGVSDNYPPPKPAPPLRVLLREAPAAVALRRYALYPSAEGGTPPYAWKALSGLPGWLEADPNGASFFQGKPVLRDVGEARVVWQVSDDAGASARSEPLRLEVLPPAADRPLPLRLKTSTLPDARVGEPYALSLAAEGGFPPYRFGLDGAVAAQGLTLSPEDGRFAGTPRSPGQLALSLSVLDKSGGQATAKASLQVRPALAPLKIMTAPTSLGRVGERFTLALSASGGYPPYRFRLASGKLPEGLNLDEQGGLSGVPTALGDFDVAFSVTDAENAAAAQPASTKLRILTSGGAPKLRITSRALPVLLEGQPADVTLACEGGTPPYVWQTTSLLLSGLRLEQGRLVGTPSEVGERPLELLASDDSGQTARVHVVLAVRHLAPFWMLVAAGLAASLATTLALVLLLQSMKSRPVPLRITTEAIPNARASCAYSVQLACEGGVPPYTWSVVSGALPPGLELNPAGTLSGRAFEGISVNETLEAPFTVQVRDRRGQTSERAL